MATDRHLHIWREELERVTEELELKLAAWVVLPNHYHLLLKLQRGRDLARLTQHLHGRTSIQLNRLDRSRGRKVWYSYWDICIRGEADFWTRFNYIHYNPVKHNYVEDPKDWDFSSYRFHLHVEGRDWLAKCWSEYPAEELLTKDKY